jgi:hypothetical protein
MEIGPSNNRETRISEIQNDLDDPAALKDDDVRDATSTIAQIGPPDKRITITITMRRPGVTIIASTRVNSLIEAVNLLLFPAINYDAR